MAVAAKIYSSKIEVKASWQEDGSNRSSTVTINGIKNGSAPESLYMTADAIMNLHEYGANGQNHTLQFAEIVKTELF